eukprot:m.5561 g.5561  ORF g.5561 m.5561 type:complete len:480 (+) comp13503_c0_seq1:65-1504(+)
MSRNKKVSERIVEYFSQIPSQSMQWAGSTAKGDRPEIPRLKENANLPDGERRKAIDNALAYLRQELVQIRIEDQELHHHLLRMRKAMQSIKKQARQSMPVDPHFRVIVGSDDDEDDGGGGDGSVVLAPPPVQTGKERGRSTTLPANVQVGKLHPNPRRGRHPPSRSYDAADSGGSTSLNIFDRNLSASYNCLTDRDAHGTEFDFQPITLSSSEYSLLHTMAWEVGESRPFRGPATPPILRESLLLSKAERERAKLTRTPPTNRRSPSFESPSPSPLSEFNHTTSDKSTHHPPYERPASTPAGSASLHSRSPGVPSINVYEIPHPQIKRSFSASETDQSSRKGRPLVMGLTTIRDADDDGNFERQRQKSASLPRASPSSFNEHEKFLQGRRAKLAQARQDHLSRSPSLTRRKLPSASVLKVDTGLANNSGGIVHSRSENVLFQKCGSQRDSSQRSSDISPSDARFSLSPSPSSYYQGTDL